MKIGDRFGRLVLVAGPEIEARRNYWHVACDCGIRKRVRTDGLRAGSSRSCGCLKADLDKVSKLSHGQSFTPEYIAWGGMVQRCTNPKSLAFQYYGGRGIRVCDAWMQFENFFCDMGPRPAGTSIDRIDNDKGYEPGNCRWVTRSDQMKNTRANRWVVLHGERLVVTDALRLLGRPSCVAANWAKNKGWTYQQTIDYLAATRVTDYPDDDPVEAERDQLVAQTEREEAWRWVLADYRGRRVMAELLRASGYVGQSHTPGDPLTTAFREGQRSVGAPVFDAALRFGGRDWPAILTAVLGQNPTS